jgi:ADP-ribosylglycohydrolase
MDNYDKIKSLMIASSLLDLLGSNIFYSVTSDLIDVIKNPYDNGEILMEYVSHFITNGGLTKYKFSENFSTSSNIILMLSLFNVLSKNKNIDIENDDFFLEIKKGIKERYLKIFDTQITLNITAGKLSTEYMITKIKYEKDYFGFENPNISSDICVIIIPVGIIYNNDIDKMIKLAIKITKLTHNNITSILSSIASAYFISLAYNEIPIEVWGEQMIELIKSQTIKKYIDLNNNNNLMEYTNFIKNWTDYLELRFIEKKIKFTQSDNNFLYKLKLYKKYAQYSYEKYSEFVNVIADDCISCLIVTYDILLTSNDNFEKIIYQGILIPGNNITIGGILGALYGLINKSNNINQHMLDQILPYINSEKIENIIQKVISK